MFYYSGAEHRDPSRGDGNTKGPRSTEPGINASIPDAPPVIISPAGPSDKTEIAQ